MELLPITLSASGAWKKYHARKHNKQFILVKKRVLQRDHYTCRYCGFFAKEFQEVVNIDQNYNNNKLDNLATACCFCAQCFFIDSLGLDGNSGGLIIFLPEITQADLNNFCRVLYCSMEKESAYKGKLQSVYLSLQERSKDVVNCFGPDTDDPRIFGQSLLDAGVNKKQLQHEVLAHLRLLPSRKDFKPQIEYWKKTVFAKVPL
ncbi:MAG TPA: type IVB secretion system protein IcmJDotN [Gammaproteobacteria bacterium]|nr:type IVB secretion system protein IcmJDotN [Gammaproteobacteria bacterium]